MKLYNQCSISEAENRDFCPQNERRVALALEQWRLANPKPVDAYSPPDPDDILTAPIIVSQFSGVIGQMKDKAAGPSGISKRCLKELPKEMKKHFVIIFNASLSLGHMPACFKHAHVTWIPKKKDAKSIDEFRPISLLEVPGKVLERIVNSRLIKYLEYNDILQNNQFGFRPKRGTETATIYGYETIARAVSLRQRVTVTLGDVKGPLTRFGTMA